MVSFNDFGEESKKQRPRNVSQSSFLFQQVSKAAVANSKAATAWLESYRPNSVRGGGGGGGGGIRRNPARLAPRGKSYHVKTPRGMVGTVAAVFLVLPLFFFMWKETHLHNGKEHETHHLKSGHSGTGGTRGHHHNAFVTWMEEAEKEASDEHIIEPKTNDHANTTLSGLIGDFLWLNPHDHNDRQSNKNQIDTANDHDQHIKTNYTIHQLGGNASLDKHATHDSNLEKPDDKVLTKDRTQNIKSHEDNDGHGNLILALDKAASDKHEEEEARTSPEQQDPHNPDVDTSANEGEDDDENNNELSGHDENSQDTVLDNERNSVDELSKERNSVDEYSIEKLEAKKGVKRHQRRLDVFS